MMAARAQVIIIGGGLAGLAAAVPLAEEGLEVTLIERKPFLGGRASSYPLSPARRRSADATENRPESSPVDDRREDRPSPAAADTPPIPNQELVDNCQHVLLRCCTSLLDFYRRLGVQQCIAFFDRVMFVDEEGRRATLSGSQWAAPFHLLPSFVRFPLLGWKEKLAIAYALFCMLLVQHQLEELDQVTMLEWLRQHRQPPRAVDTFWRTFLVSALNEEIEVASAHYGVKVILNGLLSHRQAFHIGVPAVPLSQLYTQPCLKFLRQRGGRVRLRRQVARIVVEGARVRGLVLSDGSEIVGDYYLSSVPPHVLLNLLPHEEVERCEYFARLRRFEASPITAVYLWFDRPVTDLPFAALPGLRMQWMFNKGTNGASGGWENSQCLGLVVSASRALLPLGRRQIVEMALRDVRQAWPSARQAVLLGCAVIKEPFATFSCHPACDELRPDQRSPLENFFVAGDWTQTGWPATMESAVRSGYRCAELILQAEGIRRSLVRPDLPAQGLARWLSSWFRPRRTRSQAGERQ